MSSPFQNILILCVGNVCRSPMAEVLLRAELARGGHTRELRSAGVAAAVGMPADETACRLMDARGLDLSDHRATPVNRAMIRGADLVLVMESAQRRYLMELDPSAAGKTYLLGHWSGTEIEDPYRRELIVYERALRLIDAGVEAWAKRL